MRSPAIVLGLLASVLALVGCDILAIDNYDAPTSTLSGRLVYQGEPIGVRNRGVELELWQPGYEPMEKIPVHVHHDGTFQAVLFDGQYELNLLPGNGPWVDDSDRISFEVRGDATLDVEVVPYYVVRNEQLVNNDGQIEATFEVGQVQTSRALEYVGLYVGATTFVDRINQEARAELTLSEISSLDDPITLSVALPDDIQITPSPGLREEVYVRIGIKTEGIAEMLFTQVHEVGI